MIISRLKIFTVAGVVLKKILIANRGEVAVRITRACRELGYEVVAVYSAADRDSLHAKLADQSLCIGPGPSAESYLDIARVMAAVELSGADAIHPGYGFLSENADFAEVCETHQLNFIGPSSEHIRLLGDKISARRLAQELEIPLLPGSLGPVEHGQLHEEAEKIGYPLILKAAAGGGGRGMKVVAKQEDLERSYETARAEAMVAFGSNECFMERYLPAPRHIEVQVIGDGQGGCVVLGERDCSLQRRHQKLMEEAPSPALNEEQRERVYELACRFIKKTHYRSLGTVEFLYQDDQFYFMEINPRLQVEHPVTEMIYGIDLVKYQLQLAAGLGLGDLAEAQPRGHSIECRLNAEDPFRMLPSPGLIKEWYVPGGPGVRMDSMVYSGYRVPYLYDSLLGKLIVWGKDREEACRRMERGLSELKVDGVQTNAELHREIMAEPVFQKGEVTTRFLDDFLERRLKKTS
ncbi:MAG: acetyl/propionyl/methylcrotonyl-CoA carboxylase subunit alpha [Oligoflexales bacterium]